MTSLSMMADTHEQRNDKTTSGMLQKIIDFRRSNPSKTHAWLLDEDCHNLFAFIGGFVDSAGYVRLSDLFTSSITGNLVAATASIYSLYGVVARSAVAISFAIGSYCTSVVILKLKLRYEWSALSIYRMLLAIEGLILFIGLVIAYSFRHSIEDPNALSEPQLIVCASTLSFAMGLQSAFVKEFFPQCPSTTVITMLIVTFSSQAAGASVYGLAAQGCTDVNPISQAKPADYQQQIIAKKNDVTDKFVSTSRQLVSFLLGGVIGASLTFAIALSSLFFPMLILVGIFIDATLAQSKPAAKPATIATTTAAASSGSSMVTKNPMSGPGETQNNESNGNNNTFPPL